MDAAAKILTSSNLIPASIIVIVLIAFLAFLSRKGFFSFKAKGLVIGRSEAETRELLIRQKEYILDFCSSLTQTIMSDLAKTGNPVKYIYTSYVVEKVIDLWLGFLLVNNVTDTKEYIDLRSEQCFYTVLKAIGKINSDLLQNDELKVYFKKLCDEATRNLIKGLLEIKILTKNNKEH